MSFLTISYGQFEEYSRLRSEEKARKEKEERIKNIKVGDEVAVVGFAKHVQTRVSAVFAENQSKYKVLGFSGEGEYPFTRIVVGHCDSPGWSTWEIYKTSITEVFQASAQKARGEDRRVSDASVNGFNLAGTHQHVVSTLEAVARNFPPLTDDQAEVLKAAQAKIRKDGTANGYRKGGDRRINGQF